MEDVLYIFAYIIFELHLLMLNEQLDGNKASKIVKLYLFSFFQKNTRKNRARYITVC